MKTKTHRFKTKLSTQSEVLKEFRIELRVKIEKKVMEKIGSGKGIIDYVEFTYSEEGQKFQHDIKQSLIEEWRKKGRNMAFLNSETI